MGRRVLQGNPPVEIDLRRSARARRVSLRVSALDGKVTLSVPQALDERVALDFAAEKEGWIRRQLDRQHAPVAVGIGAEVMVEGRELPVRAGAVRRATLTDDAILVPPAPGMAAARVKALLKTRARAALAGASRRHAETLGRPLGRITLRDTRSRWGSCSHRGDLMYSWRLVMAPRDVLDYVAAHEVAHLVELNHSAAYWSVVARVCPDYAAPRAWLKAHGARLHRYRFDD